ncbi:hypothetical protein Tco_0648470 [Tanacetum coccineum]
MSSSLFINSFSPGDGEDDCWVFDVDVTDSGCFCVLVDVSMGSETVSSTPLIVYATPLIVYATPLIVYATPIDRVATTFAVYVRKTPLIMYAAPLIVYAAPLIVYAALIFVPKLILEINVVGNEWIVYLLFRIETIQQKDRKSFSNSKVVGNEWIVYLLFRIETIQQKDRKSFQIKMPATIETVRDNARSSSVGVMGSMLMSFDGYSWLLTPSCAIVIDGDGEDDCWVFDVDVTDSGCFCVLVDVSMGSETVSRFISLQYACSLNASFDASTPGMLPVNSCTIRATSFLKVVIASVVSILDNSNSSKDSINQ